jgi:tyrosyl-DNA phosphodiesterase-1
MDPLEMPAKRRKLNAAEEMLTGEVANEEMKSTESLRRPISPPMSRRRRSLTPEVETPRVRALDAKLQPLTTAAMAPFSTGPESSNEIENLKDDKREGTERFVLSPIQLTRIRDLPKEQNVDTVGLEDILGDVMIKECWNFNFLFDIDWVM